MRAKFQLPETLLNQIAELPDHKPYYSKQPLRTSRKETRKQARALVKRRRAEIFSTTSNSPPLYSKNNAKRSMCSSEAQASASKKRKLEHVPATTSVASKRSVPRESEPVALAPKATESAQSESENVSRRHNSKLSRRPPTLPVRSQIEKDEDAYIAYLESKFERRRGSKPQEADGLDDLMSFISSVGISGPNAKEVLAEEAQSESDSFIGQQREDEGHGDESEDLEEEEWKGCEISSPEFLGDDHEPPEATSVSSRYIPPQMRDPPTPSASGPSAESNTKLTRQIKGLLNRMSESNIDSILEGIEEAYRAHARHDVTCALASLIIATIASPNSHIDSYVLIYAALVGSLGRVGCSGDFVPYFLQKVVETYDQHHSINDYPSKMRPQSGPPVNHEISSPAGKQAANLLHLLTCLYNLHIISCVLIFDLVRELLDDLNFQKGGQEKDVLRESDVELVLTVVRSSGPQLRSDDPSALKDIVQIVQERSSRNVSEISSRTKFMIETLINLKNNKLKRVDKTGNGPGPHNLEALERMKKFLVGLSRRRQVHMHEPIRHTLADLRSADSKGKWWLVGAAWDGDPLVDRQAVLQGDRQDREDPTAEEDPDNDHGAMIKLARKQGMNTDIRRAIFVVLMSSDDYIDACDRLVALRLTEVQQREIVKVLLHCCGNEKAYNPYYTLVCQRLCDISHAHKVTLQYSLWDFLRELGETTVGGKDVIKKLRDDDDDVDSNKVPTRRMQNVAAAYGWWIAKDCIGLAVLKPIDFTRLKHNARFFLKELLTQIFLGTQATTPLLSELTPPTMRNRGALENVFMKATRIEDLSMGLTYFLGEAFRYQDETSSGALVAWATGIAKETLGSGMEVRPLQ